jgi:hypothetical protein
LKITIDTKTDSKEDIKKAIELLKEYSKSPENSEFDINPDKTDTQDDGMMGLFDKKKEDNTIDNKDDDIKILPY